VAYDLFSVSSFGLVKSYDMPCTVESASLEPKYGNKFIAGGEDMWIRVFDFHTGEEIGMCSYLNYLVDKILKCYMYLVLDFDIIRWIFSYYFLVYIDFPCDYLFESLSCNKFLFTQHFGFRIDSLSDAVKIW
jgi:hypothetical protein